MHRVVHGLTMCYHTSFLIWLIDYFVDFTPAAFEIGTYDWSMPLNCFTVYWMAYIPYGMMYSTMLLYWIFRLKSVFYGTKYGLSKKCNNCLTISTILMIIVAFSLLITGLVIIIIELTTNEDANIINSGIFCKIKLNIVDFYPYFNQESSKLSYDYKINNFYLCTHNFDTKTNRNNIAHLSFLLTDSSLFATAIAVPILSSVILYQYVIRLNQMRRDLEQGRIKNEQTADACTPSDSPDTIYNPNANIEINTIVRMYMNTCIGGLCILTTLICMFLYVVVDVIIGKTRFFAASFQIDGLLNGYFMLVITEIGYPLLPNFCKNKFVNQALNRVKHSNEQ